MNKYEIEASFTARIIMETNNKSVQNAKKQVAAYLEQFLNDVEITHLEVNKNSTTHTTGIIDTKGNVYTFVQPTNTEILKALGENDENY